MKVWLYEEYYVVENDLSELYKYIVLDKKTDEILLRIVIKSDEQQEKILYQLNNHLDIFEENDFME